MLPVIRDLVAEGVRVSMDTTRAAVAEAAVEAGAHDGQRRLRRAGRPRDGRDGRRGPGAVDPHALARAQRPHERARQLRPTSSARCAPSWSARVDAAVLAGVDPARLVLDPGLGFAKTAEHNWALLRRLDVLTALGFPVLVGASRKRFLGQLLADADGAPRPPAGRDVATAAVSALAAAAGAWGVRVHDVDTLDGRGARWRRRGGAGRPGRETGPEDDRERRPEMTDRIELRGLRVRGHHGVFEHERRDGQDFVVDVMVWMDLRAPPRRPTTSPTPWTTARSPQRAAAIVGGEPCDLIEAVAGRVADDVWPTAACRPSRSSCTSRRRRSRWSSPTSPWSVARRSAAPAAGGRIDPAQ